jgi:hypothetical protein
MVKIINKGDNINLGVNRRRFLIFIEEHCKERLNSEECDNCPIRPYVVAYMEDE